MTTATVLAEIRRQITDTIETYRYTDIIIYLKMTMAQQRIVTDHPESMCSDTAVVITDPADIAVAVGPGLSNHFFMALVHLSCHLIFLDDSEDVGNERLADKHLDLYERSVA